MTPIERAARVLADKLDCTARSGETVTSVDDLRNAELDIGHVDLFDVVRAVLQAIREPSEAMRDAVAADLDFPWWFQDAVAGGGAGQTSCAWTRMIDAALTE